MLQTHVSLLRQTPVGCLGVIATLPPNPDLPILQLNTFNWSIIDWMQYCALISPSALPSYCVVSSTEKKGRPSQSCQTWAVSVVMSCQGYKEGCFFFSRPLNISTSQIRSADESASLAAASVAKAPQGCWCHRCSWRSMWMEWLSQTGVTGAIRPLDVLW